MHSHHRTSKSSASGKERSSRNGHRGMQRTNLNKSIDEAGVYFSTATKMSIDSQYSLSRDHAVLGEYCANKRDRNKRSDTAKRHVLARQKQIDNSELQNGKGNLSKHRR